MLLKLPQQLHPSIDYKILVLDIWAIGVLTFLGPSFSGLGSYGQTFHFMDEARAQLEEGLIDAALVVTANFILSPRSAIIAQGMGLAAEDGKCNAFDQSGKL